MTPVDRTKGTHSNVIFGVSTCLSPYVSRCFSKRQSGSLPITEYSTMDAAGNHDNYKFLAWAHERNQTIMEHRQISDSCKIINSTAEADKNEGGIAGNRPAEWDRMAATRKLRVAGQGRSGWVRRGASAGHGPRLGFSQRQGAKKAAGCRAPLTLMYLLLSYIHLYIPRHRHYITLLSVEMCNADDTVSFFGGMRYHFTCTVIAYARPTPYEASFQSTYVDHPNWVNLPHTSKYHTNRERGQGSSSGVPAFSQPSETRAPK